MDPDPVYDFIRYSIESIYYFVYMLCQKYITMVQTQSCLVILVAVVVTLTTTITQAQYVPAIPRSGLYPFYNTSDPDPSAWTGFEIEILDWMCSGSGQGLGNGV